MARNSRSSKSGSNDSGYITQRAAGYLHGGVDRVAERGERLERRLHDGYETLDSEMHRVGAGVRSAIDSHPWMALGGSAAFGFLIGLLSGRRT